MNAIMHRDYRQPRSRIVVLATDGSRGDRSVHLEAQPQATRGASRRWCAEGQPTGATPRNPWARLWPAQVGLAQRSAMFEDPDRKWSDPLARQVSAGDPGYSHHYSRR